MRNYTFKIIPEAAPFPFQIPGPQAPFLSPPCPKPVPSLPVIPDTTFRLAHAYVPWQFYNVVYEPAEALANGTLFPELNMPQGVYGPCEGPAPCRLVFPGGGVPCGC